MRAAPRCDVKALARARAYALLVRGPGAVDAEIGREVFSAPIDDMVERVRSWLEWPVEAAPRLIAFADAGPPPVPLELGAAAECRELLEQLDVPPGAANEIVDAMPAVDTHPEAWWLLERLYHTLIARDTHDAPPPWPAPVPADDPFTHYFHLYVFLAAVPDLLRYHALRRIPEDVTWRTLRDVGLQIANYHVRHGRPGFDGAFWVWPHFRGEVFTLGRLQFEPLGTHLGVHIPAIGRLTPAGCDDAFDRAVRFFATHYPETTFTSATCTSWLLDEQLADYLSPRSNIIAFQQRFTRVPHWTREADDDVLRFVFGRLPATLAELPQTTSLERAIVTHLQAGRHWQFRRGWFAL